MESFYGTHGTTKERADQICTSVFRCSDGKGGTGVYFWENTEYSNILAKGWYRFALKRGDYDTDSDKRCAILSLQIKVSADNYLDFLNDEIRKALISVAYKQSKSYRRKVRRISDFYNLFIKLMENKLGNEIYVWRLEVTVPGGTDYPKFIGRPLCYITSKPDIIKILSTKVKD